ncbi:DODA-type extradiol aromatic ring-opening family dioxygenase [Tepidibacillus fermentans]|uniref:4,5-DOPA dioxygenase extradiol n=1 Tax=Tepidibacillus fermentans TaxID=1281767 RepID=A0A4R3K8W4_9BACI|nr:class III extradiol ring-cleavage dioxygenase [Tepidibacillus fermentans]TCS79380.1 4,5-DOPA dioxygenase extradiol [Tepidibacillus fermentans]
MVPSLFISHGAPTLAIEDNDYTQFLQNLGRRITPKAIVIFTAHWESEITTISFKDDVYETIYDFYGFPEELYMMKYPATGSISIASMVEEKLKIHDIPAKSDEKRGLDHGSWVVLQLLYPNADIPVVQVSVNPYLIPKEQFKIGEALRDLGEKDILVIGSGGTSHNLRMIKWGQTTPEPWTVAFDDWLVDHVQNRKLDSLFHYEKLAPNARLAVPRPEHIVPLFIAFGSGEENKQPKLLHRSYQFGTLSHIVFEF